MIEQAEESKIAYDLYFIGAVECTIFWDELSRFNI